MNNKEITKYIVAFTYGDGYLGFHGKNCRFEANNISENRDYIEWRADILRNVTGLSMRENLNPGQNRKPFIKTTTHTHPKFTDVHEKLYLNGKKVIDPHYLKLLDWESLAIWYMDDGSIRPVIRPYKNKVYYFTPVPNIATNCFSYGDNLLIKKAIKENLGIEFNIHKHSLNKRGEQTYILCLLSSSLHKFLDGVEKYIQPSFRYKLNQYEKLHRDVDGEIVRTLEKSNELDRNDLVQEEILE